jgi:adenosine deaminase
MTGEQIAARVAAAPKAELHMHLEGALEPELLLRLAARNNVRLPYADEATVRAAYRFADLRSFLEIFWAGNAVLQTAQDFHDLTRAYLARAQADNVVHAEVFLSPQGHTSRGVPLDLVMEGVLEGFEEGSAALGMTGGVILGVQRHRSEAEALALLDDVRPWRDELLGLNLGGPEVGNPPAKFVRTFNLARDWGWRLTAHAGEEGPAAYVADTLDLLKVDRIDHGVTCEQDPALVRRLAESQVPLTVCPLSNLMLKGVAQLGQHNLRRLLQAGLCVTVNSDDPAYFGGYVNANYLETGAALGITATEHHALLRNSFVAAFITPEQRASYLSQLDAAWAD